MIHKLIIGSSMTFQIPSNTTSTVIEVTRAAEGGESEL